MPKNHVLTRRRFLQAAGASVLAAPYVTRGLAAASPNGKLRHAAFGASGMSWSDITSMSAHPNWELAAICDVDTKQFARAKEKFPNAKFYQDWRELLEKEGDRIDSVNVSTPDHMHGPIGLRALELGKHVYGQKPLAQNLYECRQLTTKAREKGVMTQMGIQISSDVTERTTVAYIHAGIIGKVQEVHTFSNKKWGDMSPVPDAKDPVPEGFDWNLWLGPATDRPFIKGYYHPGVWRKRRDFGTGTLGDMGCHMFSGWFRSLGLAAPIAVKSTGPAPLNKVNWATDGIVEYTFKGTQYTAGDTIKVTWTDGSARPPADVMALVTDDLKKFPGQGSIYIGTEGVLLHPHVSKPTLYPKDKFKDVVIPKIEPRNHWFDFIDCCLKGGAQKPSANFDYAGPLTEAVLLGCLASPFPGETLTWDAAAMKIPNHAAANALVKREYRDGWKL
ncbi:Gfo/Idh/MocA family protein [Humisphaera borealis]|uniref:Gfo/Idh/MocA family oxidoreductase n=1 Tax=Humisphaera borealis TaxID=2807512 RepID=A0A7M2X1Z4_9BACT|nr:Gfo/Idh/MocA family oxidoreductase [Humisphaera borealis]QOV91758.1 Gfo/Idh/MocA family oxidoreductase [Humisphaera borealis]